MIRTNIKLSGLTRDKILSTNVLQPLIANSWIFWKSMKRSSFFPRLCCMPLCTTNCNARGWHVQKLALIFYSFLLVMICSVCFVLEKEVDQLCCFAGSSCNIGSERLEIHSHNLLLENGGEKSDGKVSCRLLYSFPFYMY